MCIGSRASLEAIRASYCHSAHAGRRTHSPAVLCRLDENANGPDLRDAPARDTMNLSDSMTVRLPLFRYFVAIILMSAVAGAGVPARVDAQERQSALVITITTENGSILLPGASVRVALLSGRAVVTEVSDGQGLVRVDTLAPGVYHVSAALAGFQEATATVKVEPDKPAQATLDLGSPA